MNHTDYYVYAHRDLNGVVFYIGKGRLKRAYKKSGRNKDWQNIAVNGYTVEFIKSNISEQEALEYEYKLLCDPDTDWKLVNKRTDNKRKSVTIDIDYVNKHYEYDETSPTCFRWKISTGSRGVVGNQAGTFCTNRYAYIKVKGKLLPVHRVVYTLFYGEIPERMVVNHIDTNPSNNAISNLEICTVAENNRRSKLQNGKTATNNTSGANGVKFKRTSQVNSFWSATWHDLNGKQRSKSFSIRDFGNDVAFNLAVEYRAKMILELNEQGAGYSKNK